jgi:basic amino acid/polyamine antiporter, APA family
MVVFRKHAMYDPIRHLVIPAVGLIANLACMEFYLIGPFMGYGTKMEPLIAIGIAVVWGFHGGFYFMMANEKKGEQR